MQVKIKTLKKKKKIEFTIYKPGGKKMGNKPYSSNLKEFGNIENKEKGKSIIKKREMK